MDERGGRELGGREGPAWGPRGCGTLPDAGCARAVAGGPCGRCPSARFKPSSSSGLFLIH